MFDSLSSLHIFFFGTFCPLLMILNDVCLRSSDILIGVLFQLASGFWGMLILSTLCKNSSMLSPPASFVSVSSDISFCEKECAPTLFVPLRQPPGHPFSGFLTSQYMVPAPGRHRKYLIPEPCCVRDIVFITQDSACPQETRERGLS